MLLRDIVSVNDLFTMQPQYFPDKVKFCLDIERRVVAVGEEMHTDMEYELYDDGSDDKNIFGGNILKNPVSVEWEAHPNIARNRELCIGTGRIITDEETSDRLREILSYWIRQEAAYDKRRMV